MGKEFSIKIVEWDYVDANRNSYSREAFEGKELPSGLVVKPDGLYYEGEFEPGQGRSSAFIQANKVLAAYLGTDR